MKRTKVGPPQLFQRVDEIVERWPVQMQDVDARQPQAIEATLQGVAHRGPRPVLIMAPVRGDLGSDLGSGDDVMIRAVVFQHQAVAAFGNTSRIARAAVEEGDAAGDGSLYERERLTFGEDRFRPERRATETEL